MITSMQRAVGGTTGRMRKRLMAASNAGYGPEP
jgi:hypothetical protein